MALTLWSGRGTWEGWKIRKQYQGCKFGESVLVDPDGVPYSPSDILASRNATNLSKNKNNNNSNKSIKE